MTLLLVLTACGRIDYTPIVPPQICVWTPGEFTFDVEGPIETLASPRSEGQPQLSEDGLTLRFSSEGDIFEASRRARELPFSAPTAVPGLASARYEAGGYFTANALEAVVMVDHDATDDLDLWAYKRASTAEPFAVARPLDELNTAAHEWDPWLMPDGLTLYGARVTSDSESRLFVTTRSSVSDRFQPMTLFALAPQPYLGNPSLTRDGLTLVFNGVAPVVVEGLSHIYYSTRGSASDTFATAELVPGLPAEVSIREPFVTLDGCALYFTERRAASSWDIFVARYRRTVP